MPDCHFDQMLQRVVFQLVLQSPDADLGRRSWGSQALQKYNRMAECSPLCKQQRQAGSCQWKRGSMRGLLLRGLWSLKPAEASLGLLPEEQA